MLKAHALLCGEEPPPEALGNLRVSVFFENMNKWAISARWDEGTPPFSWSYEVRGPTTVKSSGSTSANSFSETFTMDFFEQVSYTCTIKDAIGATLTEQGTSKG